MLKNYIILFRKKKFGPKKNKTNKVNNKQIKNLKLFNQR
jgi:hypothetical protein